MDKETENYLKNIISEVNKKRPEEIKFKDLRKRKKKGERVKCGQVEGGDLRTRSNEEGIEITGIKTDFVRYDQIYKSRKFKVKENLEEWKSFDFFEYTHKLYISKYHENWFLNRGGNSLEINKIQDILYDMFGFSSNLIMKDYIHFFFDNYIDEYKKKYGFYFSQMKYNSILKKFVASYDYRDRYLKYTEEKNIKKREQDTFTPRGVLQSYKLGETTLLCNYGIVLSLNWLLVDQDMDKRDAVKLVLNACKKLHRKSMLIIVKKATELYSPYPLWLPFKQPDIIISKIEKSLPLNVIFKNEENDKFSFLRKNK